MVFAYYNRLSTSARRVYRKSDEIDSIKLPDADDLRPLIAALAGALGQEDREKIEELCRKLSGSLTDRLKVKPVRVRVLAVRPGRSWGELHGLYVLAEQRSLAVITVWMRTVKFRRVVAFRFFLRTLLHELCHHLDYTLFGLPESYHTEGFYKRESSLFHQLIGQEEDAEKKETARRHDGRMTRSDGAVRSSSSERSAPGRKLTNKESSREDHGNVVMSVIEFQTAKTLLLLQSASTGIM